MLPLEVAAGAPTTGLLRQPASARKGCSPSRALLLGLISLAAIFALNQVWGSSVSHLGAALVRPFVPKPAPASLVSPLPAAVAVQAQLPALPGPQLSGDGAAQAAPSGPAMDLSGASDSLGLYAPAVFLLVAYTVAQGVSSADASPSRAGQPRMGQDEPCSEDLPSPTSRAGMPQALEGETAGSSKLGSGEKNVSLQVVDVDEPLGEDPQPLKEKLKLVGVLVMWFVLNVGYMITNKKIQNALPLSWTVATSSLLAGSVASMLLWATGIRKAPKLHKGALKVLAPIAFAHALGHAGGVISVGAGAVSFAQTVKAAEPAFTCVLSYFVLKQALKWPVYASLLPILAGVSLVTLTELSFTVMALVWAMLSNISFASRAVLSKKTMSEPVGENMTPQNLFGLLTIIAFVFTLPFAVYYEGPQIAASWAASSAAVGTPWLCRTLIADGLLHYSYNEVAFMALNQISPVSHSIAKTMIRVCIIVSTMFVFGNKLTPAGTLGTCIAIGGTLLYTLVRSKFN